MTPHLSPNLRKALLAAGAFTVLALAPAALATPALSTQAPTTDKVQYTQTAEKQDKRKDRTRDRGNRSDRGDRSRNRGDRHRDRGDRSDRRDRSDRSRSHRSDRGHRGYNHNRSDRRRSYSRNRSHNSRRSYYSPRRTYRPSYRTSYRTSPRYTSHSRNYSPYRSSIGISFNIGGGGYNHRRWSPSAYSFYQPSYGSYGAYRSQTVCRRVQRTAWHHGHQELISVKECSNPWNGTYVVQGSERIIDCRY